MNSFIILRFLWNWINWLSFRFLFNSPNVMNNSASLVDFLPLDYSISVINHLFSYWLIHSILSYALNPAYDVNIVAMPKPFFNNCSSCHSGCSLSGWGSSSSTLWFYPIFLEVSVISMTRSWDFIKRLIIWWDCIGIFYH